MQMPLRQAALVGAGLAYVAQAEVLPEKRGCNADNCARAVSATRFGMATYSARMQDCSFFFEATFTPETKTILVTETEGAIATTNPLAKRDPTVPADKPKTVPTYASTCSGSVRYSSACACWGVETTTVTAPTPSVTSTVTTTSTSTTTLWRSPNLTTGPVKFPDNNDWTKTYTYYEATIPVFDYTQATQAPTLAEPTTVCMMDGTPTGIPFSLIDQERGYVFDHAGQPGPGSQPESAEAYEAWLAAFDPPAFEFKEAPGAPAGVFDLVHTNSSGDFYIALQPASGNLTFLTSSTGPAVVDGYATTVFGVSCKGYLTVVLDGTSYIWTATDDGTIATVGTPDNDSIYLLPNSLRTPLNVSPNPEPGTSSRRRAAQPNFAQHGRAPRCPDYPSNSVAANVRGGVRSPEVNGCGPANGITAKLIPNLNFGSCCNSHDLCFDNCEQGYFEGCNEVFHSCMVGKCYDLRSHWYSAWLYPACHAAADFYAWVVSTEQGVKAINSATYDRCGCHCTDPDFDMCNGSKTCQDVHGPNNNDPNNCGACGATCPLKAHCRGSKCECNDDRCGNLCVDFKSHPRNCGGCGITCPSGFCWEGACFTPPAQPDKCYPVDAFRNGGFDDSSEWTVVESAIKDLQVISSPDPAYGGKTLLLQAPLDSKAEATVSSTLHVCSNTTYELDFKYRTVGGGGANGCFIRVGIDPPGHEGEVYFPPESFISVGTGGSESSAWQTAGPLAIGPFDTTWPGAREGDDYFLEIPVTISWACFVFCMDGRDCEDYNNIQRVRIDDLSLHYAT